jgi:hypothetical protein
MPLSGLNSRQYDTSLSVKLKNTIHSNLDADLAEFRDAIAIAVKY